MFIIHFQKILAVIFSLENTGKWLVKKYATSEVLCKYPKQIAKKFHQKTAVDYFVDTSAQ